MQPGPMAGSNRTDGSSELKYFIDVPLRYPDGSVLGLVDELIVGLPSGQIVSLIVRSPDGATRREIPWVSTRYRAGEFWLRGRE